MAGGEDQDDKTEAATPRRLQKARDEGNIPLSKEFPAIASLGAATLAMMLLMPAISSSMARALRGLMEHAGRWRFEDGMAAPLWVAAKSLALGASPFVIAVLVGGVASSLLQSGLALNSTALMPDLARLSPMRGIKRMFGVDHLADVLKSLFKVGILGFGLYRVFSGDAAEIAATMQAELTQIFDRVLRGVLHVLIFLLAGQAALAAGDMLWVRLRHARSLRMTREEVRQESKENDGNPIIKGRLRRLRMQRAKQRMMAAVPTATVVVTNPTHYAVALKYERGKSAAPIVVAKGVDEVAARIRELARESGIPLVPNPPLARALYKVELDTEVPAEHFQAVAELIAFVWGLRGRASGNGPVL